MEDFASAEEEPSKLEDFFDAFASGEELSELEEDTASTLDVFVIRRVVDSVWITNPRWLFLLRWMGGERPNSNASRKVAAAAEDDDDAASAVEETWRRSAVVADRENLMVDDKLLINRVALVDGDGMESDDRSVLCKFNG